MTHATPHDLHPRSWFVRLSQPRGKALGAPFDAIAPSRGCLAAHERRPHVMRQPFTTSRDGEIDENASSALSYLENEG
jgi:hypothetical protein